MPPPLTHPVWPARLYDALSRLECWDLNIVDGLLPEAQNITSSGSREHVGFTIYNHIRQSPANKRVAVIEKIEEAGRPNLDPVRALTIKEITALPGSVHVGAHGGTHESMALVSVSEFETDFKMCQDLFENHLGRPLLTYAFPLGGYRIEHLDFLHSAGVEQILLVGERTTKGGVPVLLRLTIGGGLRGQFLAKSVGVTKRPADV